MVAVLLLRHSWARLFTGVGMWCGRCCIMSAAGTLHRRAAPVQAHHAPPCGLRSYLANLALPPCRFRPSFAAHSKRAAGICADAAWRRLQCRAPRTAQVRCSALAPGCCSNHVASSCFRAFSARQITLLPLLVLPVAPPHSPTRFTSA